MFVTKKRKLWFVAIVGALVLALTYHALNPLRWSNENLRQWVLEQDSQAMHMSRSFIIWRITGRKDSWTVLPSDPLHSPSASHIALGSHLNNDGVRQPSAALRNCKRPRKHWSLAVAAQRSGVRSTCRTDRRGEISLEPRQSGLETG